MRIRLGVFTVEALFQFRLESGIRRARGLARLGQVRGVRLSVPEPRAEVVHLGLAKGPALVVIVPRLGQLSPGPGGFLARRLPRNRPPDESRASCVRDELSLRGDARGLGERRLRGGGELLGRELRRRARDVFPERDAFSPGVQRASRGSGHDRAEPVRGPLHPPGLLSRGRDARAPRAEHLGDAAGCHLRG